MDSNEQSERGFGEINLWRMWAFFQTRETDFFNAVERI